MPFSRSRVRAALLAAVMNVGTAAAIDPIRFLRVPAIHFILRREARRRACRCASRRRLRGIWRAAAAR